MTAAAKRIPVPSIAARRCDAARAGLMLLLAAGFSLSALSPAQAATPKIRTSAQNAVPACVTPQRLMAFLKQRNPRLEPRFGAIADWYKLHGETWHVRWDYAFFQMAVETNFLTFKRGDGRWGDARPKQNNFAGLGTTGGGVPGDSYPDVGTGVLAQIQHLVVYSGEHIPNPVGARTRLKQDVIIKATASKKGRMTFADLARRWAADRHYGAAIEWVAGRYRATFCSGAAANEAPPRVPETPLARATALGGPKLPNVKKVAVQKVAPVRTIWSRATHANTAPAQDTPAETAKASVPEPPTPPAPASEPAEPIQAAAQPEPQRQPAMAVVTDLAQPEPVDPAAAPLAQPEPEPQPDQTSLRAFAFASGLTAVASNAAAEPQMGAGAQTCSVVTASYGGGKTLLVSDTEQTGAVRYTVLTVLAGFERSMLDSYIKAHAPGGTNLGEFESQDAAFAKAKELCPSAAQTMGATQARAG